MPGVTDFLEQMGQQLVGATTVDGNNAEEAASLEVSRHREDWSLSEAFLVDVSGDAILERVAEANPSPDEIPRETGFTPGEYLEYAVAVADGRLTKRALVTHTGWPPPVIDDLLATMEEQGRLVLESHGRVTLVCLPDRTTRACRIR